MRNLAFYAGSNIVNMEPAHTPAESSHWLLQVARGEYDMLANWLKRNDPVLVRGCVLAILAGCGAYGFTLGLWRAPLMGLYVAVKLPLAVFGIVAVNGLLNGMLSQLLGSGLGFRQTWMMILVSFALFSMIVGSIAPVSFFASLNLPGAETGDARQWHGANLIFHTAVIAFAGLVANLKLLRLMLVYAANRSAALRTFLGWTLGNLLVGAQVVYVCRPFFGSPDLEIEFLRPDALAGNFYLGILVSARAATGLNDLSLFLLAVLGALICVTVLRRVIRQLLNETHHERS